MTLSTEQAIAYSDFLKLLTSFKAPPDILNFGQGRVLVKRSDQWRAYRINELLNPATQPVSFTTPVQVSGSENVALLSGTSGAPGLLDVNVPLPVIIGMVDANIGGTANIPFVANKGDNFLATGNGELVSPGAPLKSFALQVTAVGGAAPTWDVRLEASVDNLTFTQIIQHTNADGSGTTKWAGVNAAPLVRARCAGITGGPTLQSRWSATGL